MVFGKNIALGNRFKIFSTNVGYSITNRTFSPMKIWLTGGRPAPNYEETRHTRPCPTRKQCFRFASAPRFAYLFVSLQPQI